MLDAPVFARGWRGGRNPLNSDASEASEWVRGVSGISVHLGRPIDNRPQVANLPHIAVKTLPKFGKWFVGQTPSSASAPLVALLKPSGSPQGANLIGMLND